jgi:TolB protein
MRLVVPGIYSTPAWSRDGTMLVARGPTSRITLISLAGDTTVIGPPNSLSPSWSPNGELIVFETINEAIRRYEVWAMNTNGTGLHSLGGAVEGEWRFPDCSTLGQIVFTRYYSGSQRPELAVMDTAGGNLARMTNDNVWDLTPSWSPDGSYIAWTRLEGTGDRVWVRDVASGESWAVLPGYEASWAPDSKRIVCATGPSGGRTTLEIIQAVP